jgi:hypothetical protein
MWAVYEREFGNSPPEITHRTGQAITPDDPDLATAMRIHRIAWTDWRQYRSGPRPAIASSRAIRSSTGGCVENSLPIFSPERNGLAIIRCA